MPSPARGRRLTSDEGRFLASLEQLLRIEQSEELDQLRHQSCPAGLVTRAEPRAVVAVEVFVEQDQVAPVRIVLELFRAAVDRPPAVRIPQEDPVSRSEISLATSKRFIILPEPVGHSILKLSP